ncbi:hypothetical protein IV203_038345 [Nitzschia inconspicua]|uniref:Uncharacterized protein n=1 Tax=Nitzschia inconspicua TaxID=303405 RepID=A0A9K3PYZ3_9STRA|nr:hypothetical protein IV203_038345 [Nitzschia inconspicua]
MEDHVGESEFKGQDQRDIPSLEDHHNEWTTEQSGFGKCTEQNHDPISSDFTATATTKVRNSINRLSTKSKHHGDVVGLKNAAKRLDASGRPRRREFLAAASASNPNSQWQMSSTPSSKHKSSMAYQTKHPLTVEEQEEMVRAMQIRNPFVLLVLGFYAAFKVMLLYLINMETILSCALTVGLTLYWYDIGRTNEGWNGGGMDYVILAFAVTSPIAAAIGMAYNRREMALMNIADFRSFASQLYMAHSLWDWAENGGRENSDMDLRAHSDAVLAQIVGISDELARFLTLPTTSRSIHRMTRVGRRQAAETVEVAYRLLDSMSHRVTRLCVYGESIKMAGLPSGELSRIRQYERFIEDCIEKLRMIKMYRTPQAFRSFARIFTFVLPPFYAPTYAQVGIDLQNLGMGIAFGIVTALGLTALFESLQVLEDPFIGFLALDGIDVREEFQVLLWSSLVGKRNDIFPDAPPYPVRRRRALTEGIHFPDIGGARDATKTSTLPRSPPSVLAFGRLNRRSYHDDAHSHASSSLTDVIGTVSRPGTAHGVTHDADFVDEHVPKKISETLEFGGLLDEEESHHNSPFGGDSTAGSYVRESNFKLYAPPTFRGRSNRTVDAGSEQSRSASRPTHRRNQTIA